MGKKLKAAFISSLLCLTVLSINHISFDIIENVSGEVFYVNTTGFGGAFTSIQDAINASKDGDTVFVYSGTYYEHVVVNKTINLVGEDRNNTIINGNGSEDVVYVTADWVNITGFTATNSGTLWRDAGLQIDSDYNTISGNNISSNNWYGIFLYYSKGSNIIDNTVSLNLHEGILVDYSTENNIIGNSMIENSIFVYGNTLVYWNSQVIDNSNTVNGKPVYYLKNQAGGKIPSGAGEVILANCTNVKVEYQELNNGSVGIELGFSSNNIIVNNNISNNGAGIYLYYSNGNNISGNIVSNNWNGIYLHTNCNTNLLENNSILSNENIGFYIGISSNNTIKFNKCSFNNHTAFYFAITSNNMIKDNICLNNRYTGFHFQFCNDNIIENNTISNNNVGIYLWTTSNFKIFHNSFIDNNHTYDFGGQNLWNDTYPSGGNFWSNYSGKDDYKGPNQNIPGKDDIGDTPYAYIEGSLGVEDSYPLMRPYKPIQNYTILKRGWNLISIPIIQVEQNLIRVLGSIDGWYDAVQWYDITDTNDSWKHHKVGKPFGNDLDKINETMGFWIHITQQGDTIFIYNGTQPTSNQTIQLHEGWNLVGYPSLTSHNRTEGLNNLTFGTHVDAIWVYNAANQKWKEIGPSNYFEIGRGYWIHAKTKCDWEVPL